MRDPSTLLKHSPYEYIRDILLSVRNLDKISVAGFLVVAQLFVLLSAPHLWDNEAVQEMCMIYFVMMAFTFAVMGTENPFYKITFFDGVTQLFFAFVVGVYLFSMLGFPGSEGFGGFESLSLLIVAQFMVIGIVEESLFRGALPKAFDRSGVNPRTSRLVSNGFFAGFHCWAFAFSVLAMIAAFFFGLLMQYVWDGGSPTSPTPGFPLAACGLHAAWNVVVIAGALCLWTFNAAGLIGGV